MSAVPMLKKFRGLLAILSIGLVIAALAACAGDDGDFDPGDNQTPVGRVSEVAPIEQVEVLVLESFPPQYMAVVKSGLPNTCYEFGEYTVSREGTVVHIAVSNTKPATADIACAEIYRTVTTNINMGSDFEPGTGYSVDVHGTVAPFTIQAGGGEPAAEPFPWKLNEAFQVAVGEAALIDPEGIEVRLVGVVEDSRCPADVVCVWAGRARIAVAVKGLEEDYGVVELALEDRQSESASTSIGRHTVSFKALDPYPGTVTGEPEYSATLIVSDSALADAEGNGDNGSSGFRCCAPGYAWAPIDDLTIEVMESFPLQYAVSITSGLPSGCAKFDDYHLRQLDDSTFEIQVINTVPTHPETVCTMIYGSVRTRVDIGSNLKSGQEYTVHVNDRNLTFVAQ